VSKISKRLLKYISYIAALSLGFYLLARAYFLFIGTSHSGLNFFFALLLFSAELHSIIHSLGFISSLNRLKKPGANYHRRVQLDPNNLPSVSVLIAARNEPLTVLEPTFVALAALNYANKQKVFLDGSDSEYQAANQALAHKYGLEYFQTKTPPKSKAEIINAYLPLVKSEYLAVFDADQAPLAEFLQETVAIAEHSKNIAFVQTPQLYTNYSASPIARGATLQQSIFFESICEAKGLSNAMFCCGTNFLMRTAVLKEVGGFDEKSVTEDFSTSVMIHSLGLRSVYYNHVRVFGMAPATLPAYLKQQFRWASGTVGVLRRLIKARLKSQIHFTKIQSWEYLLSATYYFTGWSFLIMMLCPILYLIFGFPSYFSNPYVYIGSFLPYYFLTLMTFYATMKKRHYQAKDIFIGMIMSSLSFPISIKASLYAIFGLPVKFQITDKSGTGRLANWQLWPWTLMLLLNILAIIIGISNFTDNRYAIAVNIAWCLYHSFVLSHIYRLNQAPKIQKYEEENIN